jgi:hypothetical protein
MSLCTRSICLEMDASTCESSVHTRDVLTLAVSGELHECECDVASTAAVWGALPTPCLEEGYAQLVLCVWFGEVSDCTQWLSQSFYLFRPSEKPLSKVMKECMYCVRCMFLCKFLKHVVHS